MPQDSVTPTAEAPPPSGTAPESPLAADISALISRVANQDRAAFAKLYEETAPKLLGVVLRILKDRPWADDVIQETYLKIWQRADLFDACKASPITWLVSIARNRAIDELRKHPAGRTTTDDAMDERVARQPTAQDQMEGQQAAQPAQSNKTASVVTLRRQVNRWRWSTAVASAAALVLVTVLTFQPAGTPESFVAVFQHDDQQPAFLLTVDLQNRQLNIRPVTAEPQPGKSYQLWIKSDELGPNPRSVGVLGDQMQVDQGALKQYDPALLRGATFGISLEPAGGSPTGQPTSPAIHGYLYPAGDDRNRRI